MLQPTDHNGRPASFRFSFEFCINRRRLVSLRGSDFSLSAVPLLLVTKKERKQKTEIRKKEGVSVVFVSLVLTAEERRNSLLKGGSVFVSGG
ncbi:hypothetical protein SLEP1_g22328 [Rubroshorea leprosula]|uniref:Uncharacterized protein n=1 Tax=Rubroshorea leprosula TaxID=152421 RepID=A0AAV5JJQ4_9ROSI|nr:hypothetical protein SLEP1_g22328 [Rubroshorea leprosula]